MRRKYFLLVFALIFIAGNLSAAHLIKILPARSPYPIFLIMCNLSLIALCFAIFRRHTWSIFLAAFAMGQSGFLLEETFRPKQSAYFRNEGRTRIEGIIVGTGLSNSMRTFAEIDLGCEHTILYAIPDSVQLSIGDTISANVLSRKVADFSNKFDYVTYMARRGIFHTCIPCKDSIGISPCRQIPVKSLPASLRQKLSAHIDNIFPNEGQAQTRALIKALSYGYQDEVSQEILDAFRNSGAMHLLALSGMHLILIYNILSSILSLFLRSPKALIVRSTILMLMLWSYTLFTGCGISILRAMIMISIYETGLIADRSKNPANALSLSAIAISLGDPYAPEGLSFQLSFCAMLAIFFIYPIICKTMNINNKPLQKIWEACVMAVSCSALTSPIIYVHFGTFAHFSLIVNILCAPITSFAMILVPISLLSQNIDCFPCEVIDRILQWSIELFIHINTIIASI